MIEIRTFEGGPDELSRFTVDVWRRTYEGRMPLILWSEEFFRRELFAEDDRCRDFLITAYDGAKLVGSHPSKPLSIRMHGREMPATWGSFISVDPDYRRRGVAMRMQVEWDRRHREHGAVVNLGYQYVRSSHSMGPMFWLRQPERIPVIRKLGMWVRPLDHAAVASFEIYRTERWGSRFLSLLQRPPRPASGAEGVRPYRREDLKDCLALICQAGESADLAYVWEPAVLDRQLQFGDLSRTLVMERDGAAAGMINYTLLEVFGRCSMTLGLIDLVALGTLAAGERRTLVNAALARMQADGAGAAMMLRGSNYAWPALLAAGFLPAPPEYYYIGASFQKGLRLDGIRRLQVLFR